MCEEWPCIHHEKNSRTAHPEMTVPDLHLPHVVGYPSVLTAAAAMEVIFQKTVSH